MKFGALFTLIFTINVFAFATDGLDRELFDQILMQQPESVENVSEGKLYLNPDRIFPTAQGLVLASESSAISLPNLSSDEDGCFLAFAKTDSMLVKCWNCNYEFDLTELVDSCPNCGYGS